MPGDPILLRRGRAEGRRNTAVNVKLYGERSFHQGVEKIPAEVGLCKRIFNVLNSQYPGHAWSVEVMIDQGVAKISIPALLGVTWGYIVHLDQLDRAAIIKAGGEILERFRIPRSTVDIAAYFDARKRVPLIGNFRGGHRNLIPS